MSGAAALWRSVVAQVIVELRLTTRRGENLLALAGIPAVVLLFFGTTSVVGVPGDRPVDFLLPGAWTLAVVAAGLVNLGIATAYERSYGVLRHLGASPLGRSGLVVAKVTSIGAIVVVQSVVLGVVAWLALGWQPGGGTSIALLIAGLGLGTVAFASLGLLLAGTLRADATLAVANGLFVLAVVLGGVILPTGDLPAPLAGIADVLPAAALSDSLRMALGSVPVDLQPFAVLGVWAVGAGALASRTFRWD